MCLARASVWTCRTPPRPTTPSWRSGTATAAPTSGGPTPPASNSWCTATCLDAAGRATTNGTRIIIWDCTGGTNQRWSSTPAAPSSASNPVFAWTSPTPPALAELWACHRGSNQRCRLG
ncbi:ricin-type beta-trefoil lectin domain protein [Plantactinospora solaniradicis]|uniref:Ricin-type beta-trefoil lectin domain protein n=1 Tax=Plantactinospora solaniradicis TaxID=1723736 RepID=A0ABW1KPX5_9ACTN